MAQLDSTCLLLEATGGRYVPRAVLMDLEPGMPTVGSDLLCLDVVNTEISVPEPP